MNNLDGLNSSTKNIVTKGPVMTSKAVKGLILVLNIALASACNRNQDDQSNIRQESATSNAETSGAVVAPQEVTSELEAAFNRLNQESLPINNFTNVVPFAGQVQNNNPDSVLNFQQHWKNTIIESLRSIRDNQELIPEILYLIEQNGYFTVGMNETITMHVQDSTTQNHYENPRSIEIAIIPETFAPRMASSILTEAGGRTVRVAAEFKVREWMAIMLAHEFSHVYDMQMLGENSHNPEEYLAGEVKAHLIERDLLKAWNPEAFEFVVQYGMPLLRASENGFNDFIGIASRVYPLSEDQLSQHERSLAIASIIISAAFEEAQQYGATEYQLGELYQSIRNIFGG
jgi:hypothetical protein